MKIRRAERTDASAIYDVLRANLSEISLFQQPLWRVRKQINDFVVAEDETGDLMGCSAVHWHAPDNAEILAVSVASAHQR
jgi:N-acetylglutamate synthase-like GNAT family acetyltransferase